MIDPRLKRVAEVLVDYSLQIKKGDRLIIRGSTLSAPMALEVYRQALERGAFVDTAFTGDGFQKAFYDHAQDHQLATPTPFEKLVYTGYDKLLVLWGDANTRELTQVAPKRIRAAMLGRKKIRQHFFEMEAKGKISWCGTEFPTAAHAQEASLSLAEFEDFYFKACYCDRPNPIAIWKRISRDQDRLIRRLNRVREIRIVSKDTDLVAKVAGRKWQNCDGRVNFPDGEVFTSPVENSIQGHIRFSFPGIYAGKEVEDIFLEFKDGRVVKAEATKGEALLQELIKTDDGASRVGELAIGTNYGIDRFSRNMLFDEKIGGTVHLALGAGFPKAGSKNHSTLHWDMLCDMRKGGRIFADGKLIYQNGRLKSF